MLPSATGLMARLALRALDMTASVYVRGAGGKYDGSPVKADLKCTLQEVNRSTASTAPERAELAGLAVLYWDPTYDLPDTAQIAVDAYSDVRWNVRSGTLQSSVAPGGASVLRSCDVVRVRP